MNGAESSYLGARSIVDGGNQGVEGADWIELFNAGFKAQDINGWSLAVEKPDDKNPGSTVQYLEPFEA